MNQWKIKKLGDISDMCLGKMLDKEKNQGDYQPYLANINVRWGGFDLKNLSKMRFEEKENERYGLKYGDLIICEGGEPGRCAIWKDEVPEMKIQKALHRVRMHDNYNPFFVYYRFLLAGRSGELSKHFIGSTIKHLTGVGLKQVEFEYPSLAIQNQIAAVLSSIDQKIEINNRINAELEAMAKTLYDYWFVQFDFPFDFAQGAPDENGKPYKSSGGKMVYSKELKREIPAGWEVLNLKNLVDLVKGNVSPSEVDRNIPYVGLEHISRKNIVLSAWSTPENISSEKTKFKKNDILFGKIRPYFHKVAVALFDGITSTDTIVLRAKRANYFGLVLETVFSEKFIEAATQASTGSKMPRADWNVLQSYKVAMPNNDLLETYQNIFDRTLRKIELSVMENQQLAALRDWLLPMLMNGQVQVTDTNHLKTAETQHSADNSLA